MADYSSYSKKDLLKELKELQQQYESTLALHKNENVNEIKKAELKLLRVRKLIEENEKKFRNLVWDMQVGVLLQGPNAEMLFWNPAALKLLGLTEE